MVAPFAIKQLGHCCQGCSTAARTATVNPTTAIIAAAAIAAVIVSCAIWVSPAVATDADSP